MSHGAQKAAAASGTAKSSGMTPMTRQSLPSTWIVWSMIPGSAPRLCHSRWLSTITGSPRDGWREVIDMAPANSPAWNVRPSCGWRRNTSKNPCVTCTPVSGVPPSPPRSVADTVIDAVMASNASFRATQSTTLAGDGPSRRRSRARFDSHIITSRSGWS